MTAVKKWKISNVLNEMLKDYSTTCSNDDPQFSLTIKLCLNLLYKYISTLRVRVRSYTCSFKNRFLFTGK